MTTPQAAARAAQDSTPFRVVARIGYVVLGILHIVIGAIAISVATGGGGEADQGGAMEQIQKTPAGVFLLWLIVIGLAALAIWQISEAFLERDPDTKKKWGYRVKYLGTAGAYVAIALTALVYALGGQSDSSESSTSMSAQLMASPAGVVVRSSSEGSPARSRSTSTFLRVRVTPAPRRSRRRGRARGS
jgi:hypothetical protein